MDYSRLKKWFIHQLERYSHVDQVNDCDYHGNINEILRILNKINFLGVYKIPGFADIPAELNVSLLKGAPNPRAVYSSKAVGEPPLFLASSILFAIKEAVKDARRDEGLSDKFQLISPATSARIRMACQDRFTKKVS